MASFECTKCDKTYKNRCDFIAHQRMHDGTAFACEFCARRFDTNASLRRHRIAHTFARPYACDVDGCEKKFSLKGNMQTHKRTVHERVPGNYRCEQCDRACGTLYQLNIHRRIHTGDRPFACTDCAAKFSQKSGLQTHFRTMHTLERPYACAHCDPTFATPTNRGYHERRCIRQQ